MILPSLLHKLRSIHTPLIILIFCIAIVGFLSLYSAGGGSIYPWMMPQVYRFILGVFLMLACALAPIRLWLKLAYPLYIIGIILLLLVPLVGRVGMGAQRWLDLYFIHIQPSELMKTALVLTIACYFHRINTEHLKTFKGFIIPLFIVLAPCVLILKQPDLGTAIVILSMGVLLIFTGGVRLRYLTTLVCTFIISIPFLWAHVLKPYQKNRILTFINPEQDPLGKGYHILQSKIAVGSGGFWGKGFLHGTQSHLNFLPEKQTDFIFTLFAEEWGFIGTIALIGLYFLVTLCGLLIALKARSTFSRLVACGITITFFLYTFINICMVIGLLPVVGIPLPLISYGGTSMISILIGFGLILNTDFNASTKVPRY